MLHRVVHSQASRALAKRTLPFLRPLTTEVGRANGAENSSLSDAKPFEQIPGFRSFPFIGTAWIYFPIIGKYDLRKLHHADADKYKKCGPIVKEKIGNLHLISCFDAKDVETVFRNEGKYPNNGVFESLKAYRELRKEWYTTPGVMVLQGQEWHNLRSKTQPYIMKHKHLHTFLGAMQDISRDLVKRIRLLRDESKETADVAPELYKWGLESIGYIGLDTRLGCLSSNLDDISESIKMIEAAETMLQCMDNLEAITGKVQWWKLFPTPTWNKFVKASDYFTQIALKYTNRALEELQKDTNEKRELTVLESLLRTPGLDISEIMCTVMDMLFAGIETACHTEGFLLYHLATNPEKQEKLHDEIKKVLPSPADKINVAAFTQLRYLKACMKESMRLLPIARGLIRQLDHDVVLSGYRVPAGVFIFCMLLTANRLEKNYSNANEFIPERWLDKEKKSSPYLSQAFGIGVRSCMGRRIVEQEMICATTEIIRNFRVEYHDDDLDMMTELIARPDKPLKFKFIDRT